MTARKWLFAWCAALALAACQGGGSEDGQDCNGGKCDDRGESGSDDLMPASPRAPGSISITRNAETWLCEVIGSKGEIVLLSTEYTSRTSALNGALAIEENGVLAERYAVSQSDGGWSFALRAGNNATIADSRLYASEEEARAAAETTRELVAGIVQYKAAMTGGARFVLSRDEAGKWRFDLLGEDEELVLASQLYSRRQDAITGIESVRLNGKDAGRYQVLSDPPRFILKAANGEEIASSAATFDSAEAAEAAVAATQALLVSERAANPW
ncbi:MAG TPA: DUF1508 domain-containing protein [Kofleriaceae bacterium]|nr:DUF1508 domain-containing protein [Kofleriaceae bacterium]